MKTGFRSILVYIGMKYGSPVMWAFLHQPWKSGSLSINQFFDPGFRNWPTNSACCGPVWTMDGTQESHCPVCPAVRGFRGHEASRDLLSVVISVCIQEVVDTKPIPWISIIRTIHVWYIIYLHLPLKAIIYHTWIVWVKGYKSYNLQLDIVRV